MSCLHFNIMTLLRMRILKVDKSNVYIVLSLYPYIPLPTGRLILFRECLKNGIVPVVIEDVNRNEYLDVLKEYKEEKSLNKLIALLEKEQQFYLERCKYFM